ncbi:TPA: hypothetical protein DCX15_00910 [bacterium]|nr:hypothetical protein [bacterium]
MMKILMIVASFPPQRCGVGDYTEQLCKNLVTDGVEVGVITSAGSREGGEERREQRFKVYPVVKRWGFGALFPILRLVRALRPDVIHIQYHGEDYEKSIMISLLPLILRFLGKGLRITTLHNLQEPLIFPKLGMQIFLRFSERIILTNEIDQHELIRKFPFISQKAVVIPAGPGTPKGEERREEGIEDNGVEGEVTLSYFGFLNPSKGIETLFLALKNLIEGGYKVRLLMIGDLHNGASEDLRRYVEKLKELAERFKIEDSITWTGYVSKRGTSLYLLSSDICVLPFRDGVSTKRSSLISCLDHGLPVVSTCNGFIPRGMEDHKNILLVPPDDELSLSKAIIELIEDKDLRIRLAKEAKKLMEKEYSWKEIVKRTVNLYVGE